MSSKLSKHPAPPTPPSFVLSFQPETIPWTDKLESQLEALMKLRLKHLERAKYAVENSEDIGRIKDREKSMAKAVGKIKCERDCTGICLEFDLQCLPVFSPWTVS
jgi:hypothetical protein